MTNASDFSPIIANPEASIANGQAESGAVDLGGTSLCGIHMPAAFTGTALTFKAAAAIGGTYQTVQRNGIDLAVTVAQGKYVALNPGDFAGIRFLKIVSGSNEAAGRTLFLAVRPV